MQPEFKPSDDGIELPNGFAQAVLRALGLQDMRHVLALHFDVAGTDFVPVVKITRAVTRGETRRMAEAIEAQRFKLVPDGEPERSDFAPDARASTRDGDVVTVHPLDRRWPLTLPLAEQAPGPAAGPCSGCCLKEPEGEELLREIREKSRELKDLQDGQERAIQRFRQTLEAMIQSIVGSGAAQPEEGAVEQRPVPGDPGAIR